MRGVHIYPGAWVRVLFPFLHSPATTSGRRGRFTGALVSRYPLDRVAGWAGLGQKHRATRLPKRHVIPVEGGFIFMTG